MKKLKTLLSLVLLCVATSVLAQQQDFVIRSDMKGLPDGLAVGLLSEEGSTAELANDTVRGGHFVLRGRLAHPMYCTLVTNNLGILPADNKDMSKIRWTYTPVFVSNTEMVFEAANYDSVSVMEPIGKYFRVTGGQPQTDLNNYNLLCLARQGKASTEDSTSERKGQIDFIKSHPHSVLSVLFANKMLLQAEPRLSKKEIIALNTMIADVPDDEIRLAEFRRNCQAAERTAVNERLQNLTIVDTAGKGHNLTDIIPKGKYVLIDFWASWCGICRASIPEVKDLAKKYADRLTVISVSDDRDKKAWLNAVAKENMPWAQYCLTPQGSKDLLKEYLIQGVPYYLLVSPKGMLITAPAYPKDIESYLN
jgi:thiol-disulfide isomerase/thioredoxin